MSSFTTIYRACVMIAVGAIVVKGWQFYGPSSEQVKSAVVNAVNLAESTWKGGQPADENGSAGVEAASAAPRFATTSEPAIIASAPPVAPALTPSNVAVDVVPSVPVPSNEAPIAPATPAPESTSDASTANDDRVSALLSRLEGLGVVEPKVAPWGSSGHLYRCYCRAGLAGSSTFARHFESVAAEPALAVEQIVAKVEAWRIAQRGDTTLR